MHLSSTTKILFTFFLEMYRNQFGELICGYSGFEVE